MAVQPRLNRLFAEDGNCFDVAIDHGYFNEYPLLSGVENMKKAVQTIVRANPDAIQLTVGMAKYLQSIPGKNKPSLVLRTDVANVYGTVLPRHLFTEMIDKAVEQAVALDAACVVVNLFLMPNQPEVYHQCIKNICKLKAQTELYGMPLMIEPLVMQPNETHGGYMVDGDIKKILPLVRQAVELGADIIKADPCDNVEEYHRVIEIAGDVPVLVRGGGKVSDDEILKRTKSLMEQGARGIVYGRNVVQHPHPDRMTRALMAIVHEGATVERAKAILAGE